MPAAATVAPPTPSHRQATPRSGHNTNPIPKRIRSTDSGLSSSMGDSSANHDLVLSRIRLPDAPETRGTAPTVTLPVAAADPAQPRHSDDPAQLRHSEPAEAAGAAWTAGAVGTAGTAGGEGPTRPASLTGPIGEAARCCVAHENANSEIAKSTHEGHVPGRRPDAGPGPAYRVETT